MQIKYISVYDHHGKRNDVKFKLGQLNILTGASKRGKSQLIDIIDYCLCSDECNVAGGLISDLVSCYSLVVTIGEDDIYIARKAPLLGRLSSTACQMKIGKDLEPLSYEELNFPSSVEGVHAYLTNKLGISESVTEVPEHQTRSPITIGFKHTKPFLFQAQDEIASKNVLFYRQAKPYIPQSIKDTFPFFLGAIKDGRLEELAHLKRLKSKRAKLKKSLREIEQLKGDGLDKGRSLLSEAMNLGLVEKSWDVSDDELLVALKNIATVELHKPEYKEFDTNPLTKLEFERDKLTEEKSEVRTQIESMKIYEENLNQIDQEIREQYLRLKSIELFKGIDSKELSFSIQSVKNRLSENAQRLVTDLEGLENTKPQVNKVLDELTQRDKELAKKIRKIREAISTILKQKGALVAKLNREHRKVFVIGRISLYLEGLVWKDDSEHLVKRIKLLEPKIESLEAELNPAEVKRQVESLLSVISEDMTKWARELGLEHSSSPIRLDLKRLTVVAETRNGSTPLNKMGSGSNHVGYHLIAYVALAKWFIEERRPVPQFVFFDQPSQVYFPSDRRSDGDIARINSDEDRESVKGMFKWLKDRADELSPDLQIIVTDHADIDEPWFQKSTVQPKWRGREALIPYDWIPEGYEEELADQE